MAGLFGFESLGGNPEEINKTYGVPQGIVNNANSDSMIGLGGLLMAAGQRQTPQQRAQLLSQLGTAASMGDRSLYTGAQSYLMGKKYQDEAGMADYRKKLIEAQTNYYNNKGDGHWATASELPADYKGPPIWMGENGPKTVGNSGANTSIDKEQIKAQIKDQEKQKGIIDNAKNIQPIVNDALDAYQKLHQLGDIGPLQGSKWWRRTGAGWGTEAEALKQKYDLAIAKLNLIDAPFKGQGSVSEYERKMQEKSYPTLDMSDSSVGFNDLLQRKQIVDRRASGDFSPISEPKQNTPSPGQLVDGYQFLGGDPSNQRSWKKVSR